FGARCSFPLHILHRAASHTSQIDPKAHRATAHCALVRRCRHDDAGMWTGWDLDSRIFWPRSEIACSAQRKLENDLHCGRATTDFEPGLRGPGIVKSRLGSWVALSNTLYRALCLCV